MTERIVEFAQIADFLQYFKPLSPYGRQREGRLKFFTEKAELFKEYDDVEAAWAFIRENSERADKTEYHLKRLPFLDFLDHPPWESAEIFLLKKFLVNLQAIGESLSLALLGAMELPSVSREILELLNLGGQSGEIFFLSDSYSPQLQSLRGDMRLLEDQLRSLREERLKEILQACGLDFRHKDFLLIQAEQMAGLKRELVFVESYDARSFLARPVFQESYLGLLKRKEVLIEQEKSAEKEVLKALSKELEQQLPLIEAATRAVARLDSALARARFSARFQMTRPQIARFGSGLEVRGGRFVPLEEQCLQADLAYTQVNARLRRRISVIHGSNMGGKTVMLKSLAFFQLLAQGGFFVPCKRFKTVLFQQLRYLGDVPGEKISGLSSFGLELYEFTETRLKEQTGRRTLYIMDEFARTTNSLEARALICAVLGFFSASPELYGVLATHYMGLPGFRSLAFLRMRGLNYRKYLAYHQQAPDADIKRSIRGISRFMEYELEADPDQKGVYDALKVAEILGLDKRILLDALQFFGRKG